MPYQSRYQGEQFERILNQILDVMQTHQVDTPLALMLLGNATTHIFNTEVPAAQRHALAQDFVQALLKSIEESPR